MMAPESKNRRSGWRVHPREQQSILVIGDFLVAYLGLAAAIFAWSLRDQWLDFSVSFIRDRVDGWYFLLPIAWILLLVDSYEPHRASNWRTTSRSIAIAAMAGLLFYAVVYLLSERALTRVGVGFFLFFAATLTLIWRLSYIWIFTAPAFMRRIVIIGAGKAGLTLVEAYRNMWPLPFKIVGFIDDDPKKIGKDFEGLPVLAGSDKLFDVIKNESISDLVIAITGEMRGTTFQTILDAQERGIEVTPMPTLYEELFRRVPIHHLESEWLLRSFADQARAPRFYELAKRLLDIFGAILGLLICMIIYPTIAVLIMFDSGFPINYRQIRLGRGGKPYHINKFRTMRQDAEKDGKVQLTQQKDGRITRVGNMLRRTHIDELPQFLNVLRGEMSLVGPRAERPEWIAEFQQQVPFYRARLLVKPGITGWAQVNYSYYATVEEMAIKLEYDLYYIKHRSLLLDIAILLRTIGQVIGFRGR
ncbi:MAG: sugar transferase [Chloroflexota bacterium]